MEPAGHYAGSVGLTVLNTDWNAGHVDPPTRGGHEHQKDVDMTYLSVEPIVAPENPMGWGYGFSIMNVKASRLSHCRFMHNGDPDRIIANHSDYKRTYAICAKVDGRSVILSKYETDIYLFSLEEAAKAVRKSKGDLYIMDLTIRRPKRAKADEPRLILSAPTHIYDDGDAANDGLEPGQYRLRPKDERALKMQQREPVRHGKVLLNSPPYACLNLDRPRRELSPDDFS